MSMPGAHAITRAADALRRGELVAFPTETVYGLGADAASRDALRRLYQVKRRPLDHPVIVHVAAAEQLGDWAADVPAGARQLAHALWPGPLTLVLARAARVPDAASAGLATIGVRVPDQPVALALLREFGGGVAAPSANRFGRVSPTTADDVRADLGDDVAEVLDGGQCRVGIESTIVDWSTGEPAILRLGGVARETIEQLLGGAVPVRDDGAVRAPGTLPSHYAPRTRVEVVDAPQLRARAAALTPCGRVGVITPDVPDDLPAGVVIVGVPSDADDYAHSLYRLFRAADRERLDVVLAVPPPGTGIGAAVADRLRRAAGSATGAQLA
jgi:L-threonylcarbamoyladenylate synthase